MRALITVIFFCLLSGCATTYKPDGISGGYTDTQISENAFRVSFNGNGYTKPERAADLALLRCAEITLAHGYSFFVIVDGSSREKNNYVTMPSQSSTSTQASIYGNNIYGTSNTVTTGGNIINLKSASSTNTILCLNEKPKSSGIVYEAKYVLNNISSKYGIKNDSSTAKQNNQNNINLSASELADTERRYKSRLALEPVELGMTGNSFVYDIAKWDMTDNKPGEINFFHTQSIMSAQIIYEPTPVPLNKLPELSLNNAKALYKEATLDFDKTILVNDNLTKCYKINSDFSHAMFYSSSDKYGTVQIIVWSNKTLFDKYILEVEEFLNGYIGQNKNGPTWESKSLEEQRKG